MRAGERALFEILMRRHNQRVYRAARAVVKDEAEVEDVMQQAYINAFTHLDQFEERSQFSTWLHRLVVNTCHDVADRQRVRRCEPLLEDERVSSDADPAREAALSELRHELAAELGTLSREQASVVVLKDALGFSFAEISEQSGMPVGTAKCYAHRARAGLRARLTDEHAA